MPCLITLTDTVTYTFTFTRAHYTTKAESSRVGVALAPGSKTTGSGAVCMRALVVLVASVYPRLKWQAVRTTSLENRRLGIHPHLNLDQNLSHQKPNREWAVDSSGSGAIPMARESKSFLLRSFFSQLSGQLLRHGNSSLSFAPSKIVVPVPATPDYSAPEWQSTESTGCWMADGKLQMGDARRQAIPFTLFADRIALNALSVVQTRLIPLNH